MEAEQFVHGHMVSTPWWSVWLPYTIAPKLVATVLTSNCHRGGARELPAGEGDLRGAWMRFERAGDFVPLGMFGKAERLV